MRDPVAEQDRTWVLHRECRVLATGFTGSFASSILSNALNSLKLIKAEENTEDACPFNKPLKPVGLQRGRTQVLRRSSCCGSAVQRALPLDTALTVSP